jgi:N-acetylglutamate synthase-like GNAT family acetyltransferase
VSVALRTATLADAPAIAALYTRVRAQELAFLPVLHTAEDDVVFFRETAMPRNTVWVAEEEGRIVGFVAWHGAEVDCLYVDADNLGRGIGTRLLHVAMADQPKLELWAFARNARALSFYRKHGFRVLYETDGANNEEKEPDVRLGWERDQSSGA